MKKNVGRPAIHDPGIRHVTRPKFNTSTKFHITIKVRQNKASIQSKKILKVLHRAILLARQKKLKIVHYTLEYNHIHLLIEAKSNEILSRGMQAFGISFSKSLNLIKKKLGPVYKHRYHFRQILNMRQYHNVRNYIFKNGIKHKRTLSKIDPFNSYIAKRRVSADIAKVLGKSTFLNELRAKLEAILDRENYLI